mgnify:CR=1 FL=1
MATARRLTIPAEDLAHVERSLSGLSFPVEAARAVFDFLASGLSLGSIAPEGAELMANCAVARAPFSTSTRRKGPGSAVLKPC